MALLLGVTIAAAQDEMMQTPFVDVSSQVSVDGTVTINEIYSDGPGWIVIHADNGEGAPGPVIGYSAVNDGTSVNVAVPFGAAAATPTLFAMLHADTGEVGTFEFGMVEGADGPVVVNEQVVTLAFDVEILRAYDQFLNEDALTVAAAVVSQDGFVVVHADSGEGTPGPVIGFAPITAGMNTDVAVPLDGDITRTLFPMLHVDTGEVGTYEFGQVEGADSPIAIDGAVAVTVGVPSMRVPDQIVTDTVTAESVVSEGPGWLVIHQDDGEGAPGPVIGFAAVEQGTNTDVTVGVEADSVTPALFPMLHVDTGEVGTYEFGQVEGADEPVTVDDTVLAFPINAAPSITYSGSLDEGNVLTVDSVLIDAQGWLVIHADSGEGIPGPVIGYTPIVEGVNENVTVTLDAEGMTDTLFPMLHYDTGEVGVYEFGQVEGADLPVNVNDAVVTGPLTPDMGDGM
ncbi:MAG: DUF7282 domain-containing protein [Phototrophicaceae bacterium]